jgi:predicted nucleic acid-binding protein
LKVLDAWAILAWLKKQQPAADRVRPLLDTKPLINIVNLGEVYYIAVKMRDVAYGDRILSSLRPRLTIVPAGNALVLAAARLKSQHPISYADAFAAATAIDVGLPLVTGDPELQAMTLNEPRLKLDWIGAKL